MSELESPLLQMDQDTDGERKFCRLTVSSLRAFKARWTTTIAVEDAYSDAIRTLELMDGILAEASAQQAAELMRVDLAARAQAEAQAQAEAARKQAIAWAETPPAPAPAPVS